MAHAAEAALSDNPFWDFSLGLYGHQEVREACLLVQDEAGADVNIVLYLLWCARTGRRLDAAALAAADAAVSPWRRHVVEPLRGVRRDLKGNLLAGLATEELRGQVKALELAAERLEQDALFTAAPLASEACPVGGAAELYLTLYADRLGRELPGDAVRVLLDAVGLAGE